jgi:hypothetical protein
MADLLFWLYLVNSVLLINHEIDSAYWKEWDLFLIIHFPLLFFILYGLVQVFQRSFTGLIFSLIVCVGGIFAFGIHLFFIKKGREAFNTAISLFILSSVLIVSLVQFAITLYLLSLRP